MRRRGCCPQPGGPWPEARSRPAAPATGTTDPPKLRMKGHLSGEEQPRLPSIFKAPHPPRGHPHSCSVAGRPPKSIALNTLHWKGRGVCPSDAWIVGTSPTVPLTYFSPSGRPAQCQAGKSLSKCVLDKDMNESPFHRQRYGTQRGKVTCLP